MAGSVSLFQGAYMHFHVSCDGLSAHISTVHHDKLLVSHFYYASCNIKYIIRIYIHIFTICYDTECWIWKTRWKLTGTRCQSKGMRRDTQECSGKQKSHTGKAPAHGCQAGLISCLTGQVTGKPNPVLVYKGRNGSQRAQWPALPKYAPSIHNFCDAAAL